ncbi:MAG: tetratricopeptide repeat protein [Acidobacteriia bacterium]|nr:tetratricopeptide repeat protein [Terriglobia bacterium]
MKRKIARHPLDPRAAPAWPARAAASIWFNLWRVALVAGFALLLVGLFLRWVFPEKALIVGIIRVPERNPIGVSGDSVANLLFGELKILVADATAMTKLGSRKSGAPSELLLDKLQKPTRVGIEISGISLDRAIAEWRWIREDQSVIDGELLLDGEKMKLHVTTPDGVWESAPFDVSESGLKQGCRDLGLKLFTLYAPDIAGRIYLRDGLRDKSAYVYERWTFREPKSAAAFFGLGLAEGGSRKYEKAVTHLERAAALDGNDPAILDALAIGYATVGEFRKTEATFEAAARISNSPIIAENYAHFLLFSNRYQDALKVLSISIDKNPDDAQLHTSLGLVYDLLNKCKLAEAALRTAIRLDPSDWRPYNHLLACYLRSGRYKEGLEAAEAALARNRDNPDLVFNVGVAMRYNERYTESYSYLTDAFRIAPNYPPTRCELGLTLRLLKREREAAQQFAEAKRLDPEMVPPECGIPINKTYFWGRFEPPSF